MMERSPKKRRFYTPEFKKQAVQLAKDLSSPTKAAEKLGIKHPQTLLAWINKEKKTAGSSEFRELQKLNRIVSNYLINYTENKRRGYVRQSSKHKRRTR